MTILIEFGLSSEELALPPYQDRCVIQLQTKGPS